MPLQFFDNLRNVFLKIIFSHESNSPLQCNFPRNIVCLSVFEKGEVEYKVMTLNEILPCRLEFLFRFVHNGIPVLSHAERKMKKELEDIKTLLQFHRESLDQVQRVSRCQESL